MLLTFMSKHQWLVERVNVTTAKSTVRYSHQNLICLDSRKSERCLHDLPLGRSTELDCIDHAGVCSNEVRTGEQ